MSRTASPATELKRVKAALRKAAVELAQSIQREQSTARQLAEVRAELFQLAEVRAELFQWKLRFDALLKITGEDRK